jgi:hypothetical protein
LNNITQNQNKSLSVKEPYHSVSKECKFFKDCPFCWDCLYEIALNGSVIWSLELCYDLKHLIDMRFVAAPDRTDEKIFYGMLRIFGRVS